MNTPSTLSFCGVPLPSGVCIRLGALGGQITRPDGTVCCHPGRTSAAGTQLPAKSKLPARPVREHTSHDTRFDEVKASFRQDSNKSPWKH